MAVREPDDPATKSTARGKRSDRSPWNWLLLLPLVVTLFPPIYNKIDPGLFNVPFFYWYQMAAIVLSVIVTLAVYQNTRD